MRLELQRLPNVARPCTKTQSHSLDSAPGRLARLARSDNPDCVLFISIGVLCNSANWVFGGVWDNVSGDAEELVVSIVLQAGAAQCKLTCSHTCTASYACRVTWGSSIPKDLPPVPFISLHHTRLA
jgi:hypothetical protein